MSDPAGPVYLCFDVTDQESAIEKEIPLPDPTRFRPPAPLQAEAGAIKEAARLLSSAQNPVIVADYVGRNNDAVLSLIGLADLLSIPVIDLGARLNFPNTHPLNLTGRNQQLIANADVILGLDVMDLFGALVRHDPGTHSSVSAIKPGCKVIHVTLADISMRGWTSDFQELAPVDLPIVANTRVFLPALTEEIRQQGKFSKSVVDDRRKSFAAQHEEIHARWQADLKKRWDEKPIAPPRLAEPSVDLGQAGPVPRRLRRRRSGLWAGRVGGRGASLPRHRQDLRQHAARRRDAVHFERDVDRRQHRCAALDRDDQ
jgi:thiamine pyrophosphate-dependent acetolactate synthase large subunit-like protein